MNRILNTFIVVSVFCWNDLPVFAQNSDLGGRSGAKAPAASAGGKIWFLILAKSKAADAQELQQRGIDAVRRIAKAAGSLKPPSPSSEPSPYPATGSPQNSASGQIQLNLSPPNSKSASDSARFPIPADSSTAMDFDQSHLKIEALAEVRMTVQQLRSGAVKETVNGKIFRDRLKQLAKTATAEDTVVIYTHSHGYKNGFETAQPLGGLVMNLPALNPEHRGALLWDEYVDLILEIPAKNVVVLTMSCFSGGFVDFLNSQSSQARWKDRQSQEGRNLIVLTSQNDQLVSQPIMKDSEVINPFTLAVAQALSGQADGFALAEGRPVKNPVQDGKISVGELIDYVVYTTEHTVSDSARLRNTAKPKLTGSFNRDKILFEIRSASAK